MCPAQLPPGYRLTATNQKAIAKAKDPMGDRAQAQFFAQTHQQRERAIARWYRDGGRYFLKWAKKYYRTHDGSPLSWDEPYLPEFFIGLGNPFFTRIIVIKAAQMGFTESLIALCAFLLAELRLSVGFCVDEKGKLQDVVPPRLQPAFDQCSPIRKLRVQARKQRQRADIDSKQRNITVGGTLITFCYAGTKSSQNNEQSRQVSSSLTSFTALTTVADEVENFPSGVLDILAERQGSSTLPSKPMRCGSTPGGEGGIIDIELKNSVHHFDWWFTCEHCQFEQFLDPFGNLFQQVTVEENGIKEDRFIDMAGNPYKWFHHCAEDAPLQERLETAFIGCRQCGKPVSREVLDRGHYADIKPSGDGKVMKKGVALVELCDRLLKDQQVILENVTINLPRLASHLFNASERIGRIVRSRNKADGWQQGFGKVSSIGGGKINRAKLLSGVGRVFPEHLVGRTPDRIVMGVDQGQSANIVIIDHYWLGDGKDPKEQWENAFKETVWFGYVAGGFAAIEELAKRHGVTLIGVDLEPEAQAAGNFGRSHPAERAGKLQVFPMDQVVLTHGEPYRKSDRIIQGVKVPIYLIDRTYGLDAVRDRILLNLHRMPEGLELDEQDEDNFLYHFQTLDRLIREKRWTQAKPDHYMMAANFSEMACQIDLCTPKPKPFVFGSVSMNPEV